MPTESNSGQQGPQGPTEAPAASPAPTFEGTAPAPSLPEDTREYPQYAFYGHGYGSENNTWDSEARAKEWADTLATRESLKEQIAARQAEREKEAKEKEGKDK